MVMADNCGDNISIYIVLYVVRLLNGYYIMFVKFVFKTIE